MRPGWETSPKGLCSKKSKGGSRRSEMGESSSNEGAAATEHVERMRDQYSDSNASESSSRTFPLCLSSSGADVAVRAELARVEGSRLGTAAPGDVYFGSLSFAGPGLTRRVQAWASCLLSFIRRSDDSDFKDRVIVRSARSSIRLGLEREQGIHRGS